MDATPHLTMDVRVLLAVETVGLSLTVLGGMVDPATLGPQLLPDPSQPARYLARVRGALTSLLDWWDATEQIVALFGEPGEAARFALPIQASRQQAARVLAELEAWEQAFAWGEVAPGDVLPAITFTRPPLTAAEQASLAREEPHDGPF
jgi:hypothetical protein